MNYIIKYKFPTNKEFNELFNSVGWGKRETKKINQHRLMSVFSICIYAEEEIVGMARVVGDGSYYTVYDVVTKQNYQGNGIGKLLMEEIIKWYKSIEDSDTYLYLGASFGKEKFYEKFGFVSRPYSHMGAGMKYDPNYKE
ncbi:MAG: GNAT family N-acetyltransferase [Candidatus Cloacimonetes bacterium]|nr:GNAT family N-acetyltransferase [Candidatus Cloacimonadota bacterium]